MITSIFIFLSFLFGDQNGIVPKVVIHDSDVLKLIDKYGQHIKQEGFDNPHMQQLLLRIANNGTKQLVYIGSTNLISAFLDDTPDSYAEYGGRIIYIYSDGGSSRGREKFIEFYDQFESFLGNDITRDIKQNPSFKYGFVHNTEIWRAEFLPKGLTSIKKVPQFPSHKFCDEFKYNDAGQILYKDGIFHSSAIDPDQLEPDNFDLRIYILQNTSVPEYILQEGIVNAVLVIDEKGKVIEAVIEGLKDEKLIHEVSEALREMPEWHPGKVNGKPVTVRFRQRL